MDYSCILNPVYFYKFHKDGWVPSQKSIFLIFLNKYVSFFCKKLTNKKSSLYLPNESTWPMLVMEVLFLFQRRSVSTTSSKKLIWESIWASELDFSQHGTSDNDVSRLIDDSVFDILQLSTSSYIVDRESFDLRSESKIINKTDTISEIQSLKFGLLTCHFVA